MIEYDQEESAGLSCPSYSFARPGPSIECERCSRDAPGSRRVMANQVVPPRRARVSRRVTGNAVSRDQPQPSCMGAMPRPAPACSTGGVRAIDPAPGAKPRYAIPASATPLTSSRGTVTRFWNQIESSSSSRWSAGSRWRRYRSDRRARRHRPRRPNPATTTPAGWSARGSVDVVLRHRQRPGILFTAQVLQRRGHGEVDVPALVSELTRQHGIAEQVSRLGRAGHPG